MQVSKQNYFAPFLPVFKILHLLNVAKLSLAQAPAVLSFSFIPSFSQTPTHPPTRKVLPSLAECCS